MGEQGRDEGAVKKLIQARTSLLLTQPFFGALALRLVFKEDRGCNTMWTDGKHIGYSPDFVHSMKKAELCGVLCHEVLHNANGHPWRRGNREGKRFGLACDYAIDPLIQGLDGIELPDIGDGTHGHIDPALAGKSAEQIYTMIQVPPKGKGAGGAGGEKGKGWDYGEVRDGVGGAEEMGEWQIATSQAAKAAKAFGRLPGNLESFIEGLFRVKVDWRSLLWRFVQQTARCDYGWQAPNKRFLAGGLYLPSLRSEEMGPLVVAIDTSGSVPDALLGAFGAEVNAIVAAVRPESLKVIYCDARVQKVEDYAAGETFTLRAVGRGGTDFRPPFDLVEKEGVDPVAFIYLTDLEGPFPEQAPGYPVLWIAPGDHTAPFGDTVNLREEDY